MIIWKRKMSGGVSDWPRNSTLFAPWKKVAQCFNPETSMHIVSNIVSILKHGCTALHSAALHSLFQSWNMVAQCCILQQCIDSCFNPETVLHSVTFCSSVSSPGSILKQEAIHCTLFHSATVLNDIIEPLRTFRWRTIRVQQILSYLEDRATEATFLTQPTAQLSKPREDATTRYPQRCHAESGSCVGYYKLSKAFIKHRADYKIIQGFLLRDVYNLRWFYKLHSQVYR